MKQYEAVITALELLGGYATLGELYQKTLSLPEVTWGTRTPCATIRRIVQERKEIFKIRPGLWALESHRTKLPAPLLAKKETRTKSEEVRLFDHTYYQGLLVQLGNAQSFHTYVPAQNKNCLFLGRDKLSSFVSTTQIPSFTYSEITDRVKYIDVIWFNTRKLPKSVFEVEHSTDIKNSLTKFAELVDFRVEMQIVADEYRIREYESVLSMHIFDPIKKYVGFLSYQQLTQKYEKVLLLHSISQK